jgi:hypothetical protein
MTYSGSKDDTDTDDLTYLQGDEDVWETADLVATTNHHPTYLMEKVDEIPTVARQSRLYRELEKLTQLEPGTTVRLAHYSGNGAMQVRRDVERGKREIPVGQFEFYSVKSDGGGSDLYVTYLGGG